MDHAFLVLGTIGNKSNLTQRSTSKRGAAFHAIQALSCAPFLLFGLKIQVGCKRLLRSLLQSR